MPRKTRNQKDATQRAKRLRKNPAFDGTLFLGDLDPLASVAGDAAVTAACSGLTPAQKCRVASIIHLLRASGAIEKIDEHIQRTKATGERPEDSSPEDASVVSPTKGSL